MASFKIPFQRPRSPEEHFRNAATVEAWVQRYAAMLYTNTNVNAGAGAFVTVPMELLRWADDPRTHDAVNGVYRVRADGLYLVTAALRLDAAGFPTVDILLNGGQYVEGVNGQDAGMVTALVPARKGDSIGVGWFNPGGANSIRQGQLWCWLSVHRCGPHPDDLYR